MDIKFWFMHDNHLFTEVKGDDLREIAIEFIKLAKKNPYGMICQPFIGQEKVGISVHVDKDGNFDIKTYFKELLKNETIRQTFKYTPLWKNMKPMQWKGSWFL